LRSALGRAVEPLVREALARLLPAQGIPAAPVIGGYWTRSNDVEIDIVGADREPIASRPEGLADDPGCGPGDSAEGGHDISCFSYR
jgi:hypothetical protein